MAVEQNPQKSLLDSLYCEEEEAKWGEIEDDEAQIAIKNQSFFINNTTTNMNENDENHLCLFPLLLLEQDLSWDDGELEALFVKERETRLPEPDPTTGLLSLTLSTARKEAVEWVLKVNARYGFSPLTAVLAVNYLDRFLFGVGFQSEKPWTAHLLAVACLSLAAKVEETHVPLLLDLQVEDAKYYFEAKTVQRMELLVLSGLKWRMNPVTPLSFLDHVIRRLGLKTHVHWEFLRSCEDLLLSLVPDPRFSCYLPSVLATATMLHVIHQVKPCSAFVYENQLLGVLKINKEELDECYELMISNRNPLKRRFGDSLILSYDDDDGSNDSWASMTSSSSLSSSSSSSSSCISSSAHEPIFKKARRIQEETMRLPSLNRVFVDPIGSPH
ncbi:Cyclin-D3-2 [Striga hermonthica]|uniref:Cyclin-D3-2 n=1 Tax=Striga hermonthica TaxID=68872 RepID=A0A9N7MDY9_STRHE|nr:Cyclin-D3-2 [Striga hermonthica]